VEQWNGQQGEAAVAPELPPATQAPRRGFQKPADYYSSPPSSRSTLPAWVTMGCGVAGLLAMVLMFAGANFVSSSGAGKFLSFMFTRLQGELGTMMTSEVSQEQRDELSFEMDRLIKGIERNDVSVVALQPLLRRMNEMVSDQKITPPETAELTTAIRRVNDTPHLNKTLPPQ
jgi:hypothetical protein